MASLKAMRAAALAAGTEARVTVNQRALISKLLARYCEEDGVILRELVQNADDAGATHVQLRFLGAKAPAGRRVRRKPGNVWCKRLDVVNNGRLLTDTDWNRVVCIAAGNDADEMSTGMYGVGLYSTFALSPSPMIKSGAKHLVFTWKGNSLATFAAESKHEDTTTISLPFAEPTKFDLHRVADAVAAALCYTRHITRMSIHLDGKEAFTATRTETPAKPLRHKAPRGARGGAQRRRKAATAAPPQGGDEATPSPQSSSVTFTPSDATVRDIVIRQRGLGYPCCGVEDKDKTFRVVSLTAAATTSDRFRAQCQHILKKDLPKVVTVRVLYPQQSADTVSCATGRIVVGIGRTAHTTGCAFHIHAPCIPTMERSRLDIAERSPLRPWNLSLVRCAGVAARLFYDDAISGHETRLLLQQHAFEPSTPTPLLSDAMLAGFFAAGTSTGPTIPTAAGLVPLARALLPPPDLCPLVDACLRRRHDRRPPSAPVIAPSLMDSAPGFFRAMRSSPLAHLVSPDAATALVADTVFTPHGAADAMRWCAAHTDCRDVLRAVSFAHGDSVVAMARLKFFPSLEGGAPPALPPACLPAVVASRLTTAAMRAVGLRPLPLSKWLAAWLQAMQHAAAADAPDADACVTALAALSARHGQFSRTDWGRVTRALRRLPCVPVARTSADGSIHRTFVKPQEAYLPSAAVPARLPTVDVPLCTTAPPADDTVVEVESDDSGDEDEGGDGGVSGQVSAQFLATLGVRGVPELSVMLQHVDNAAASSAAHDNAVVVRRLLDARRQQAGGLTEQDRDNLRASKFLTAVGEPTDVLFSPNQLCTEKARAEAEAAGAPASLLSCMRVVQWRSARGTPCALAPHSEEGQFLLSLGLQQRPAMDDLLRCCHSGTPAEQDAALRYLLRTWDATSSQYRAKTAPPFLPCIAASDVPDPSTRPTKRPRRRRGRAAATAPTPPVPCRTATLVCAPKQCVVYANPFVPSLAPRVVAACLDAGVEPRALGVADHPSLDTCTAQLRASPPTSHAQARTLFTYLGTGDVTGMTARTFSKLKATPCVPVEDKDVSTWRAPKDVFVASCDAGQPSTAGNTHKRKRRGATTAAAAGGVTRLPPQVLYEGFATFVDFGDAANAFLRQCGAKTHPAPADIARMLLRMDDLDDMAAFHATLGTDAAAVTRYLGILHELAAGFHRLDKTLVRKLRAAHCFVAFRRDSGGVGAATAGVPCLCRAADALLIDHAGLAAMVQPLCAPGGDKEVQAMYATLGAKWISDAVTEACVSRGSPVRTAVTAHVQDTLRERLPLLLVTPRGDPVQGVNTKASAAMHRVRVRQCTGVAKTVTFQGTQFACTSKESPTCVVEWDGKAVSEPTLLLVAAMAGSKGDVQWLDIADEVSKHLYHVHHRAAMCSHVAMVLSSSPDTLRRRGLLVDTSRHVAVAVTSAPPTTTATPRATSSRSRSAAASSEAVKTVHVGGVTDFASVAADSARTAAQAVRAGRAGRGKHKLRRIVAGAGQQHHMDHECEHMVATDLRRVSGAVGGAGIPIFVDASVGSDLPAHILAAATEFGSLLAHLAPVLGCRKSAIHMFFHPGSSRIGFNSDGALFFSLCYYAQCHFAATSRGRKRPDALHTSAYWLVVMAHELAHNVEAHHNHLHEDAMESILARALPRFHAMQL